ncbi:MAG: cytochrome c [Gammaproteobacteria bacterium]|nr:cytochrome c [Gammaproteobacteria bacterium]
MNFRPTILAFPFLLVACASGDSYSPLDNYSEVRATTILDAPSVTGVAPENQAAVNRGEYLVELLGCGVCHTDGALIGEPDMRRALAGSSIGVAYTSPFENKNPGIVFATNLTPDRDTGIGRWTDDEIKDAIRAGLGRHGPNRILVMPWQAYARISDDDAWAIVAYLRSLEPVENTVPVNVPVGRKTDATYVHFGVYRSKGLPGF